MSIVPRAKISVGTFVPTQISGCHLWLDAADPAGTGTPPSNNATVATWRDKSGNARHSPANSTGATFNTNSQNGNGTLSFTTGQYYTTPSFVATANNTPTIFLVCQQTSAAASGNSEVIYANIGTPQPWYTFDLFGGGSTKLLYLNIYANVNTNGGISIATPTMISVVGTGSPTFSATMWGNGTSNVSFTGSSLSPMSISTPYSIGAITAFIGKIYEVLFYDTPLSDTVRQQIEGYLAQKWGLTSQLPAGHPGLTQTFYGTTTSTVFTPIVLIPYNLYTNYNPLTVTGSTCILWLDASDPTTLFSDPAGTTLASVNGTVGYWRDKSSSGFNCTQTTLAYRPTYVAAAKNGRSILSFNGLTNFLNMPQFTAVPLTIFFVAQGTVFLTNTFFLSLGNAGSTIMMRMLHIPEYYGVDGPGMLISTTNADTNWHLWSLTISSTTVTFYFDGVLIGNSVMNLGSAYTFATNTIGAWNQQVGSKATTLRIPEILFYSAVLGTSQQKQVESYLTEKWGLVPQPTRSVASIVAVSKFVSVIATGGTITYATVSGIEYKIHSFTTVGTENFTLTSPASLITTVLVVAGGGAGGFDDGGGGGAGGVIYNAAFTITSGSYTVTVGNGGTSNGASGGNSVLSSLTAIGGGGGANGNGNGSNGGSGGGLGWGVANGSVPGSGTAGQGFAGGGGTTAPNYAVGGGGGAGGVGGTGSGITPGNGGIGVSHTIAGTTYNVGGGGGGGLAVQNTNGTNSTASFGGGNGAGRGSTAPVAGTPNTGGGGGGANNMQAPNGAFGGSGIVIISYRWK